MNTRKRGDAGDAGDAGDEDAAARTAAIRVCKLRRVEACGTASEAQSAGRAASRLIARYALNDAALAAGAALDAAPTSWDSERLLVERPAQELLLAALRASGRTLRNGAGTSAGDELGLSVGQSCLGSSMQAAFVHAHRPCTRFDLVARDCAARTVADILAMSGGSSGPALEPLLLGRPACGFSGAGAALAAAVASAVYANVRPPDVVVLAPEAAMTLTLRALLGAGDLVVCQWPTSPQVLELLVDLDCRVLLWRPESGPHGLSYTLRTLEALLASSSPAVDPVAVLLSLPSEPIGWLPSRDVFASIMDACRKRGSYVIADETGALCADESQRLPPVADVYELGVSVASLGGAFGLAALRCGWVACTNRAVLRRIDELYSYTADTSLCSPADTLALIALQPRTCTTILRQNRDVLATNRELLLQFLERHAQVLSYTAPMAGCSAYVQLLGDTALSSAEFCRRAVQAFGVLLLPDTCYERRRGRRQEATGSRFCMTFGGAHFAQALAVLDGALLRLGHTLGTMDVYRAPV
jgi:aspartate/methionine/tyrosine aminotransferase